MNDCSRQNPAYRLTLSIYMEYKLRLIFPNTPNLKVNSRYRAYAPALLEYVVKNTY